MLSTIHVIEYFPKTVTKTIILSLLFFVPTTKTFLYFALFSHFYFYFFIPRLAVSSFGLPRGQSSRAGGVRGCPDQAQATAASYLVVLPEEE
jgi:hypothetical protein